MQQMKKRQQMSKASKALRPAIKLDCFIQIVLRLKIIASEFI
jgi:hypothetical protein